MAHFAQLNENNKVINIIVVSNDKIINPETGLEDENIGINFCKSLFGKDTNWIQTSYNSNFRGNFAGIGFSYEKEYDIFLPPKPYDSWIIDLESIGWKAPIPKPNTDEYFKKNYQWIESKQEWFSIKEYIYNKYAKNFEYSEIEKIVNTYNLIDNKIIPIHGNENYTVSIEKVKNFLIAHMKFDNWSSKISNYWIVDYENHKYTKANTIHFSIKYCPDEKIKSATKKFMGTFNDYYLLEEINDWVIFKRDKII